MNQQQYEDAYNKWFDSLPATKKAKLKAQGLDKPIKDDHRIHKSDPTFTLETTSVEFDYDSFDHMAENENNHAAEELGVAYGCQMLRWVFERLLRAKNETTKRLEVDTLMMALGMEQMLGVKSQTELSLKHNITRAGISARVKSWQKFLGLNPTSTMKSISACKNYKASRLKNLTRN